MSKTFVSRPSVSSQRGRGRGRGNVRQPAPQTVSPLRGQRLDGRPLAANVTKLKTKSTTATNVKNKSVVGSKVNKMSDNDPRQNRRAEEPPGDRPTDAQVPGFTVISPNEKKRQQVVEQARREEQAYEQHQRQKTRPSYSYVGTVGGAQCSQDAVRQKQMLAQKGARLTNLEKQRKWREQAKQREQDEIDRKLAEARTQAQRNEERKKAEAQNSETKWDNDRRRTNESFLRRLEGGVDTPGAANNRPGPQDPAGLRIPRAEGFGGAKQKQSQGRQWPSGGNKDNNNSSRKFPVKERSTFPHKIDTFKEETENIDNESRNERYMYSEESDESDNDGERFARKSDSCEGESVDNPLANCTMSQMSVIFELQDMFPHFGVSELNEMAGQTGYSLEATAALLAG